MAKLNLQKISYNVFVIRTPKTSPNYIRSHDFSTLDPFQSKFLVTPVVEW